MRCSKVIHSKLYWSGSDNDDSRTDLVRRLICSIRLKFGSHRKQLLLADLNVHTRELQDCLYLFNQLIQSGASREEACR